MVTKRIYIAGPVNGNHNYKVDFFNAEMYLQSEHPHQIVNPVTLGQKLAKMYKGNNKPTEKDYMIHDIYELFSCDKIYMLKGWETSVGARAEHAVATALKLEIIYQ